MLHKIIRKVCPVLLALSVLCACASAAAEKTIVLTFTGDCTLGSEEMTRNNADSFDTVAAKKGYDYFFKNFKEMFSQDDLTVINLESVLSDSKANENKSKRYRFRGPTEFVKIITGSSIEACSLANNHTLDFGKKGEENTKKTLEANGIKWFKSYSDYYIYKKDGIKIGFVAFHSIGNEFEKVKNVLRKLKNEQKVNAIVVCWHEGLEYRGAHEAKDERTAKAMVKYGADLVIMHHPHVLQGMTIHNNRTIFFSLGNFVFGGNNRIRTGKYLLDQTVSTLYSVVVQAKLTFSNKGKYLGQQITLYPVYTSSGEMDKHGQQVNNYQPYRVKKKDAAPVRDAIQRDSSITLPKVTTGSDGLSKIEFTYLAASAGAEVPEGEDGAQGGPEDADPAPTRDKKGK